MESTSSNRHHTTKWNLKTTPLSNHLKSQTYTSHKGEYYVKEGEV